MRCSVNQSIPESADLKRPRYFFQFLSHAIGPCSIIWLEYFCRTLQKDEQHDRTDLQKRQFVADLRLRVKEFLVFLVHSNLQACSYFEHFPVKKSLNTSRPPGECDGKEETTRCPNSVLYICSVRLFVFHNLLKLFWNLLYCHNCVSDIDQQLSSLKMSNFAPRCRTARKLYNFQYFLEIIA